MSAIALVVTCRNEGRHLQTLLPLATGVQLGGGESLLIDLGSTDAYTRQVLARIQPSECRVVTCDGGNVAQGWNTGARTSSAPVLAMSEAGLRLNPAFLASALAALAAQPDRAFIIAAERSDLAGDIRDLPGLLSRATLRGPVLVRRTVWDAVSGCDEQFAGAALLDLLTRLIGAGLSGVALATPADAAASMSDAAVDSESMERFYEKHRAQIAACFQDVLIGRERVLLGERERWDTLNRHASELQGELTALNSEIGALVTDLSSLGPSRVEFGDLRRTTPISPVWGLDRGIPIDRYYISQFLGHHRADVRGHVLEVKDPGYTVMFGDDRVTVSDVLDILPTNPRATIVADLAEPHSIGQNKFDCFILTQTLGLIYDARAALANAFLSLKPGGVLLCTLPASGRISYEPPGLDGDYWRFTEASTRRLFSEVFPIDAFEVVGYGNVLSCAAFLYGLGPHELTTEELDEVDPYFPVVYGVRAVKR